MTSSWSTSAREAAGKLAGPRSPVGDHTSHNQATYDRIAARYAQRQAELQGPGDAFFDRLQAAFTATVPDGGLVADLGCGPALDGRRLVDAGLRVVGVDRSLGMLRQASEALPGRLAQGDLRRLPLADAGVDGVWCAASLLHVPERDTTTVLDEFRRAIRPGGVLALVTALGDGTTACEAVPYAPGETRWFVYRPRTELLDGMTSAGFELRDVKEIDSSRRWITVLAGRP